MRIYPKQSHVHNNGKRIEIETEESIEISSLEVGNPSDNIMDFSQASTVKILETNTILEATKHMNSKKQDYVLILNAKSELVGIVTDRDLCWVIANNIDVHTVPIKEIMTSDPLCIQIEESAMRALELMVKNHFRHLPVKDASGEIVGVLEISQCLHDALCKLELLDAKSTLINDNLQSKHCTNGRMEGNDDPFLETKVNVLDSLDLPKIGSIVRKQNRSFIQISESCTVVEACRLMQDSQQTGCLIIKDHAIKGIFTTKDLSTRVLSKNLDPSKTVVETVMSRNPSTISTSTTVISTLRKMHMEGFHHCPVTCSGRAVGVVDCLQLTWWILEYIKGISEEGSGRIWNDFWTMSTTGNSPECVSDAHESDDSSWIVIRSLPVPVKIKIKEGISIASIHKRIKDIYFTQGTLYDTRNGKKIGTDKDLLEAIKESSEHNNNTTLKFKEDLVFDMPFISSIMTGASLVGILMFLVNSVIFNKKPT